MEEKIKSLINNMQIIMNLIDGDFAISITDKNECVFALDGKNIKAPLTVGPVPEGPPREGLNQTLKEKKVIDKLLSKEIHGIDMRVIQIPITNDEGEVIGSLGMTRSTAKSVEIKNNSEELMNSLEETNKVVADIANNAQSLSEKLSIIIEKTKQAESFVRESDEAVNLIQSISKQSNLLGLNASIESARAGEHGKGFSIVASEMRKLALLSGESSKKISSSLFHMSDAIKTILTSIQELGDIAANQAASVEEVSATVDHITLNSNYLVSNLKENIRL